MDIGASAAMTAAMMLPAAVPATVRAVRAGGGWTVPRFVGSYLAVWVLVSVVVEAAYRPHGTAAAAIAVIAAGVYELTPLKRTFRRRCSATVRSGFEHALCCTGSCIGLMLVLGVRDRRTRHSHRRRTGDGPRLHAGYVTCNRPPEKRER